MLWTLLLSEKGGRRCYIYNSCPIRIFIKSICLTLVSVYKKRSAFMVTAFSIVIVTGLLFLFILMSLNNTLFSIQGSFSLLQSGYGQE
jgi:hypothetical protein